MRQALLVGAVFGGMIACLGAHGCKGSGRDPEAAGREAPAPTGQPADPQRVPLPTRAAGASPSPCQGNAQAEVRGIVGAQLGIEPRNLDVRQPLARMGARFDDLDFVEVVMAIEDRCAVTIDDSEASSLAAGVTIEQLARVVDRKLE